jgi:hypothetical protein
MGQVDDDGNGRFERIKGLSATIVQTFVDDVRDELLRQVDGLRSAVASGELGSLVDVMQGLHDAGYFLALQMILSNPMTPESQMRLLKFQDFVIQSVRDPGELNLLMRAGYGTRTIMYDFTLDILDIAKSFFAVLKGVSNRIGVIDTDNLVLGDAGVQSDHWPAAVTRECALYSRAVHFIIHADSVVKTGARLVVLNVARCGRREVTELMGKRQLLAPWAIFLDVSFGPDDWSFVSDVIDHAPYHVVGFVLGTMADRLRGAKARILLDAVQNLSARKARAVLQRALAGRESDFGMDDDLELLGAAVERRLLLWDTAVTLGLAQSQGRRFEVGGLGRASLSGRAIREMVARVRTGRGARAVTRICEQLKVRPAAVAQRARELAQVLLDRPVCKTMATLLEWREVPQSRAAELESLRLLVAYCGFLHGRCALSLESMTSEGPALEAEGFSIADLPRLAFRETKGRAVTALLLPERGPTGRKMTEQVYTFPSPLAADAFVGAAEGRQRLMIASLVRKLFEAIERAPIDADL